jgi:hypothetical protein
MPTTGLRQEFDLSTRNEYTKVKAEVGFKVEGRELPNMDVLGAALEAAIELIKNSIRESYKVPPRVDTPMAEPYANKAGDAAQ